jgi:hypothetical protein
MPDSQYQTQSYKLGSKGVIARYINDDMPPGSYQNLLSLESRAENALATRLGVSALTTDGNNNYPLGGPVVSVGRMKGLTTGYRYAAAAHTLYRRAGDTPGQFTPVIGHLVATSTIAIIGFTHQVTIKFVETLLLVPIGQQIIVNGNTLPGADGTSTVTFSSPGLVQYITSPAFGTGSGTGGIANLQGEATLSGNPISMAPYRPSANANPYQFIADSNVLLKDNGIASNNWGSPPPQYPAIIEPGDPSREILELFDAPIFGLTLGSCTGTFLTRFTMVIGSAVTTPGIQTVNVATPVASISRTAGLATATTLSPHNLVSGMRVSVTQINGLGTSDSTLNAASVIITVTGPSSFTYPSAGANSSPTNEYSINPVLSLAVGQLVTTNDATQETVYISAVQANSFTANFANTHLAGFGISDGYINITVIANTLGFMSAPLTANLVTVGDVTFQPNDYIALDVYIANPSGVNEIKLWFDVSDGTFTQDYYFKSITPPGYQPAVAGTIATGAAQTNTVFGRAAGLVDVRQLGVDNPDLLPGDYENLVQLRPSVTNPGAGAWSRIIVRLGEFNAVGAAGNVNNTFANVVAFKISIQTAPNAGSVVGFDNLVLVGGSGLDSFAGDPYDYEYTWYNINTGLETAPSIVMQDANFLAVQRAPIAVTMQVPTDPQYTHFRLYRRGGSLTQDWYMVDQIPINFTQPYEDIIDDATIENNDTIVGDGIIDNDCPIISVLESPVNQTISVISDSGQPNQLQTITVPSAVNIFPNQTITIGNPSNSEQAQVISVNSFLNQFTVYLQNAHVAGEPVSATTKPQTTMNLMAIAFDQAFLAGDPANPHVLYYSKTYNPEVFPQENFIEVGTPDSPIMALVVLRGLLYVFTTKTVFQIYGGGGSTPIPVPTGCMHGLVANFAWAASENVVFYMSYDGVYAFQGSGSAYMTLDTEWVWTGKNLGPVPAIDTTQKNSIFMAYANHEVFVSYVDQSGIRRRMVWSDQYTRWRPDLTTPQITSEFFEQDTGQLVVGGADGMVYLDRINDYDSGGFMGGVEIKNAIAFALQTAQMDMGAAKAFKNFNELTIDANLNGNTVNVSLVFDNGATVIPVGTISGTGRQQYQININNGEGQQSLNVGLLLTGSTTSVIYFNEIHVRFVVLAEFRRSYDSYWLRQGVENWKIWKQGWFEYDAADPGGIVMNVYIEGNLTTPAYSFTLPQSTGRTTKRVRFPAKKAKLWRIVGTSASDFQMWMPESLIESKIQSAGSGYTKAPLSP